MKNIQMRSARGLQWCAVALAVALCFTPARSVVAQDQFFAGKTVNLVVGYSAGGGYDQYTRVLAHHFGRHIPGNPTIVVQNMPGAASFTAVRYLSASAPKDGTAITMFDPGLILESLSAPDKFNVKFSDYQWLGGMSREVTICYAWHATGIETWDDMMKRKEFLIGLTAKGSAVYANGATLRRFFKAPIRQIPGYPGSNEQRLAIERGELEGACASWSAIPQDWIVNRKINVLARFGPIRPADMPAGAPYVNDLVTTQEDMRLLDILNSPGQLGRPFILAREVPKARMQVLISAFAETLKDPALLAEAQKQSLPIELFSAEESEKIISNVYSAPPELIRKVKEIYD
jgi:tripartite-type tricarboxylate transporter receptor subunit TctC